MDYHYAAGLDSCAVLRDGKVIAIVTDLNLEWIDAVALAFPDCRIIPITAQTGTPQGGSTLSRGKFTAPAPFLSWKYDRNEQSWRAPIPYPNDGRSYYWREDELSWEPITERAPCTQSLDALT